MKVFRVNTCRIALALAVLWTVCATSAFAQFADGVAAVVNDKVITFSQVKKEVDPLEQQLKSQYAGLELIDKIKEERLSALKSLIERELIIQDFNKMGGYIPDNYIEDQVRRIIKREYDNDRIAFIRTLQARGLSQADFKEELRKNIVVRSMNSRNVQDAVIVSPFQIEQYYQENVRQFVQPDQVRLRLIFMKKSLFTQQVDGKEVDPNLEVMQEIKRKVETGSDFASLAKGYSEGARASDGGDMGWISEGTLRQELSKVAFKLKPGQNSDVITTADGYYILQVDDVQKSRVVPLADVRADIEKSLELQEKERLRQQWLDGLRSKAFIKMFF
jgi:parvulin-like peptidyl-prolyl isomerase